MNPEMWKDWAIVCSFRCGHVSLNAQWKYSTQDRYDERCSRCSGEERETIRHFLFECNAYEDARAEWMARLKRNLRRGSELQSWDDAPYGQRLKTILFPLQGRLQRRSELENDSAEVLLQLRLSRLENFVRYVRATKRWDYAEDRSYLHM